MRFYSRFLIVLGFGLGACSLELESSVDAAFECGSESECPGVLVCVRLDGRERGLCRSSDAPCTERVGGETRASVDGVRCAADGVPEGRGVCASGVCVATSCGDGILDAEFEACDDGPLNSDTTPDACRSTCDLPFCGDGVIDAAEACDDGNDIQEDACSNDCEANTCGDGILNPQVEECDDGALASTGQCLPGCVLNVCGDGALWLGVEECEDLNRDPNDGCTDCRLTVWEPEAFLGFGSRAGAPERLELGSVGGVVRDRSGNTYISDRFRDVVWRIEARSGRVFPFIGNAPTADPFPKLAAEVQLNQPTGLELGPDDILFLSDRYRVLRIDLRTRLVDRIAGENGCFEASCLGDGGSSLTAGFSEINDIAFDGSRYVYVADGIADRIRRVDTLNFTVSTMRSVDAPQSVAVGPDGWVYFSVNSFTLGDLVYRFFPGLASTFSVAGTGTECANPLTGCGDGGLATNATLNNPADLRISGDGQVYIADTSNRRVRRFTVGGNIETVVGNGASCSGLCPDSIPAGDPIGFPGAIALSDDDLTLTTVADDFVFDTSIADADTAKIAGSGFQDAIYSGVLATAASVQDGNDVATSDVGVSYLLTNIQYQVLRRELDGLVTQVTGNVLCADPTGACGDGGPANQFIVFTEAMGSDPAGNLDLFDVLTGRVRRIERASETIDSVAGNGSECTTPPFDCGDGGAALQASFTSGVSDLAPVGDGSVYIADGGGNRIRYVDTSGTISTVWGTGSDCGTVPNCGDGLPGTEAPIDAPSAIDVDSNGDLYALDASGRVRRWVAATGLVETVLDPDFRSGLALLGAPATGFVVGEQGDLVIQYDLSGDSRTVRMGTASPCAPDGSPADQLCVREEVRGLAAAADGSIFIAEGDGGSAEITPDGIGRQHIGRVDDSGLGVFEVSSLLFAGHATGFDDSRWFVADGASVRLIDAAARELRPVAGYVEGRDEIDGQARFFRRTAEASGIVYDSAAGVLYFSDAADHLIYRVSLVDSEDPLTWTLSLFAGDELNIGDPGFNDGPALEARFNAPAGLALDLSDGSLYVADRGNHVIRRISGGEVATVAGTQGLSGSGDVLGQGVALPEALFDSPEGLAVDADGSLIVADTGNNRVRRISFVDGFVYPILGDGSSFPSGDGTAAAFVSVPRPVGIAIDRYGNLFAASGALVVLVSAGADGFADDSDPARFIYGRQPRLEVPESATTCLQGLALAPAEDRFVITDRCSGFAVVVSRVAATSGLP